jgi:hypothetical protein
MNGLADRGVTGRNGLSSGFTLRWDVVNMAAFICEGTDYGDLIGSRRFDQCQSASIKDSQS